MTADWQAGAERESFPRSLPPMLAVAGTLPHPDPRFGFEFKWDGVRAVAYLRDGGALLRSRNGRDMTGSYPELAGIGRIAGGRPAVLDGEIVAFDEAGRPSFEILQQRMHVQRPQPRLVSDVPVTYYLFDIVHLDGYSTRNLSYADRRDVLEGLRVDAPSVAVPPSFHGGGADVLHASREQGLEGVMAKRLDSPYRPGRRTDLWIKVKISMTQEVVVGGWTPGTGRRGGSIGSLAAGIPERGGLRYVGNVGTGFTEATLRDLMDRLRALERPTSPFSGALPREYARDTHFVEPRLVGEVRFTEWTRDGILRHPSWRGLRPDKSPADVHRE